MQITLNGEEQTLADGLTLEDLLRQNNVSPAEKGVAVAVNAEVIPKGGWADVRLEPGDRVDVIHAVQGG
jgi:sulfur carrier protein